MSENGTRTVDNRKPSQSVINSQQITEAEKLKNAQRKIDMQKGQGIISQEEENRRAAYWEKIDSQNKLIKSQQEAALKHKNRKLAEGGMPVDTYPNIPPEEMAAAEASQLPDEEMEDNYLDFVIDESLSEEEQTYLMNSLEADPQLSVIFDKVVDTASEFSGAGMVEGPGTGVSDSIPARLSDGAFVMTRKATDAIGPDNLQGMMDEAERAYDGGYMMNMAFGGAVEEDELEDSKKDSLSKTDEEIRKVMIGSNRMPSVR